MLETFFHDMKNHAMHTLLAVVLCKTAESRLVCKSLILAKHRQGGTVRIMA